MTSGGKPIAGAIVTVFDETKTRRDTVYADAQGRYSLATDICGKISGRARTPYFEDVWITSNMSDRIFRFTPSSKTFVSYPLPTRVTWLRDLVFAKDGGICSSSSNLPAYGIEGGRASFICLYPDGETAAN